jgi:hypothetical protein
LDFMINFPQRIDSTQRQIGSGFVKGHPDAWLVD